MMNTGKATRIAYTAHFYEDGRTIDLISIGLCADDGRTLYYVNADMPFSCLPRNSWLMNNVAPYLPIKFASDGGPWDRGHPDYQYVTPKWKIAESVQSFIALETENPHLWADHAAYAHVALAQLWGRMDNLPYNIPMWSHDLQQRRQDLAITTETSRPYTGRHALWDAQYTLWQLQEMDRYIALPR